VVGKEYNRDPFALGSLIALMMEAARTSETSVDNYFTRQYIPEDKSELDSRRRENLKSQLQHSSSYFLTGFIWLTIILNCTLKKQNVMV
jgi:hypothetical protein